MADEIFAPPAWERRASAWGWLSPEEAETLHENVAKLRDALLDMTYQFAYEGTKGGKDVYHTGGLSALEHAFDILGWADPCPKVGAE